MFSLISVKVSSKVTPVILALPVFLTLIVYTTVSPRPSKPSPFSITVTVLVTFIELATAVWTKVGSSSVFPSVSSPSSLMSVTSPLFPGLLAIAVTLLLIKPVFETACSIV